MAGRESQERGDAGTPGDSVSSGVGRRIVARLVDTVLLFLLWLVIQGRLIAIDIAIGGTGWAFFAFWLVVFVGYFALMESKRGQTIGKMMMKLETQGPYGEKPTLRMTISRNLWYGIATWLVATALPAFTLNSFLGLGAAMFITVTIRQSAMNIGWHDRIAGGTRVVKAS